MKKFSEFLLETNDFYNEFEARSKRLKLFVDFKPSEYDHSKRSMEIDQPKKKFKPTTSTFTKKSDKSIF